MTKHDMLARLRSAVACEPLEAFHWIAHLDDGTTYPEIGPDGTARSWGSVPHPRVVALEIMPQRADLHGMRIEIDEHVVPVFFRRRQVEIKGDTGEQLRHQTITVIGMEYVGVVALSKYWAFYPNGDTRCTTDKAAIG